jgi:hypothetical protein
MAIVTPPWLGTESDTVPERIGEDDAGAGGISMFTCSTPETKLGASP